MGPALESLLALQEIELQIVDIRRQLRGKERAAQAQADRARAAESALEAERDAVRRTQVQMDELDLDLKDRSSHVARLRDNLNTVKTNKEYAAVMSQLNNEKADVTRLEARAFEMMESLEARKRALSAQQDGVQQEKQKLDNLEAQLNQSRASFANRLTQLEEQRRGAFEALDDKAGQLFTRIAERYEGEAMARVVQPHPRRQDFMCEGCNMSLAAERANALMTRDEVITCDNCGRILFMDRSR
jgi:uncharacterized protein